MIGAFHRFNRITPEKVTNYLKILAVFVVFETNVVQKWLETFGIIEVMKFCSTAIAVGYSLYFTVYGPIDEGKNWQTEPVSKWNKDNPNKHDRATNKLVEIF